MNKTAHDQAVRRSCRSLLQRATSVGIVLCRTAGRCCAIFAVLLAVAGDVSAQDRATLAQDRAFNEAVAALKLGNYALAAEQFTPLAQSGHLAAQYNLGWMRAQGLGGPVDLIAAYQWFALVAKAGQEKAVQALHEVRNRMTAAQIAEGDARIAAWQAIPP